MAFPIATTPTLTLTFTDEDLDLTTASNVYVTLKQNDSIVSKSGTSVTVSPKQIVTVLSQSDTIQFSEGFADIQANWVYQNGKRACSNVQSIKMSRQLLKAVIE